MRSFGRIHANIDAISSPVTIPFRMERALAARIVAGELNRPRVESSSAALVSSTHTAQVVLATLFSRRAASHPRYAASVMPPEQLPHTLTSEFLVIWRAASTAASSAVT